MWSWWGIGFLEESDSVGTESTGFPAGCKDASRLGREGATCEESAGQRE